MTRTAESTNRIVTGVNVNTPEFEEYMRRLKRISRAAVVRYSAPSGTSGAKCKVEEIMCPEWAVGVVLV